MCLAIHRGGGAEQYHADKKYKEEVAIEKRAREACGDDTKGQMYGHPMTESIVACGLQTALDNFRGAIVALAETERTARRLLGSAHPVTAGIEVELRDARAELSRARRRVRDRRASERSPRGPLRPPPALAVDDGLDADVDDVLA